MSRDSDTPAELKALREAIDEVDRALLEKLNERAELVLRVGDFKRGSQSPVYVAGRERDLVAALLAANPGPFPNEGIAPVFREIISATRSLEERVCVAYLGPEGTFSHQAAVRQFGSQVELLPAGSMREVIAPVERGKAHFGVVPIENTIEGVVTQTLDSLVEAEITICGELLLEISPCLMSQSGERGDIQRVVSHPQALAQCRRWLETNLPEVGIVEAASTAAAAKLAAEDAGLAAIGSEVAADVHGLQVIERAIQDQSENFTRFLVVGREAPAPSGNDLTSAVFTVHRDQSGALFRLLEPFARYEVNLTSVQARPIRGKHWEYLFFVDMEGHERDEAVGKALDEAASYAHSHKVLGSFPRAAKKPRMGERK